MGWEKAREMGGGHFRALAVLSEDPGSICQHPHDWLTAIGNPSSRGLDALFWPPWVLHGVQTDMQLKHPYP